ncbi:thiamine-repressible mitochondrial transport protein THI74 [Verticillium alfalfae VaMs.102]|uniref:Thiamine-repressible mitochondrial transport protein THI74 n=1 Tax=Verticillium alfalfae (strain VaMs.102 / ATCC MYA-4576 / FGSC 10136) TaxID=526221 RepID=C9SG87_VERA1|nr:thiamine-repressible mitochondrial transport protein THI74 [Verticillium alfalfae VaMs.102]EEY18101.1 thiamine-repressible mitochondrial transport protein THI74 [Verticillium alfalfae VaMs.102]
MTRDEAMMGASDRHSHRELPTDRTTADAGPMSWRTRLGLDGVGRRTLGIACLLLTVALWTMSNFLASYIFSDSTYDKPFFVVYLNTSVFAVNLVPMLVRFLRRHGLSGLRHEVSKAWHEQEYGRTALLSPIAEDAERLLVDDEASAGGYTSGSIPKQPPSTERLNPRETAFLSLEFCMLWFLANYFASACLQYTSVASVTILTSTSSVWTLLFCATLRLETFSMRKLFGVLASLAGVVLISTIDLSGSSDESRGSFPHKTTGQIALGDGMAFLSAIIYGVYVTIMKWRVGNEERVDMQLFFGLVGLFNLVMLWPVFFILHWTGIETFDMPPTAEVWVIILVNAFSSFVSDISWAYAMLLTTPVLVTVGLSLTIPLSLIGEMIQYSQHSGWVYWVGAAIVFISFVFVNHESKEEDSATEEDQTTAF